jgi:hypothetical protein
MAYGRRDAMSTPVLLDGTVVLVPRPGVDGEWPGPFAGPGAFRPTLGYAPKHWARWRSPRGVERDGTYIPAIGWGRAGVHKVGRDGARTSAIGQGGAHALAFGHGQSFVSRGRARRNLRPSHQTGRD